MSFCGERTPELDELDDIASQGQCSKGVEHHNGMQRDTWGLDARGSITCSLETTIDGSESDMKSALAEP